MIEKDEKWFLSAVEALREESLSEANATRILIELFHLGVQLPQKELSVWLSIEQKAERIAHLKHCIEALGSDPVNASMLAELFEQLSLNTRHQLMASVLQTKLPSLNIALHLLNIWYRANKNYTAIPFSVAQLAFRLGAKGLRPSRVLCRGLNAETLALAAGTEVSVVYELPGPQSGESLKRALINVAGSDVELRNHLRIEANRLAGSFTMGLIADAWGSRSMRSSINKLDVTAGFSNVSPGMSELMHMMERVSGRIVCVVPQAWLYKTVGDEAELKRRLISSGRVDAVIQLPERTLIGVNSAPAILVINAADSYDAVQFIDARDNSRPSSDTPYRELMDIDSIVDAFDSNDDLANSKYVALEEVLANDANLDVNRYFVGSEEARAEKIIEAFEQVVPLEDAVDIIRCQAIRQATSLDGIAKSLFAEKYKEISPVQINRFGVIQATTATREIHPINKDVGRAKRQVLETGDILFAIKGTVGKCALVTEEFEGYIGNQSFVILRSRNKEKMPPLALFRYLISPLGKTLVKRWATTGTVPMIKIQDLKSLPVPIFSETDLEKIEKTHGELQHLISQLANIETRVDELVSELWPLD